MKCSGIREQPWHPTNRPRISPRFIRATRYFTPADAPTNTPVAAAGAPLPPPRSPPPIQGRRPCKETAAPSTCEPLAPHMAGTLEDSVAPARWPPALQSGAHPPTLVAAAREVIAARNSASASEWTMTGFTAAAYAARQIPLQPASRWPAHDGYPPPAE